MRENSTKEKRTTTYVLSLMGRRRLTVALLLLRLQSNKNKIKISGQ